jgi:hypothetical protein
MLGREYFFPLSFDLIIQHIIWHSRIWIFKALLFNDKFKIMFNFKLLEWRSYKAPFILNLDTT